MLLFEELQAAGDLTLVANSLAREFRDRHGLPAVYQLGLVVPDVEAAARELEAQGIGPFFIASGSPVFWRERGEERAVRGKMGLAHSQGLEFELLEPTEGSHFYRQSLDPAGRSVLQHVGLLVQDVDEWADRLTTAGSALHIRGRLRMTPWTVDFAYMDTAEEAGLIVEFIAWRILSRTCRPPANILKGLGALEKWSGKRSISL